MHVRYSLPIGLLLCLTSPALAVTVSTVQAPATARPGESVRVTWTTNSSTRVTHTNVHWGTATGSYASTTAALSANGAGSRSWSATIVAPATGTVYLVIHAQESNGPEAVSAERRCSIVVTPTTPTTPATPTTPFDSPVARLHADVDRDGQVTAADDAGRDQWSTSRGVVLAYNNDDDDGDLRLDCDDSIVNGANDSRTMTRVVVARLTIAATSVDLAFSPTSAPVRVFRRTGSGWSQLLAPGRASAALAAADVAAAPVELLVEAAGPRSSSWDGGVTLTLSAQGSSTTRDSVRLRCAPLIYVDNTRPAERVYAMRLASGQGANLPFWNALQNGLNGQGVPLQDTRADRYQYDRWVQDGMQLGYQSYVGASGQQVWMDDFNQLERGRGLGPLIQRELLGPNRGMAYGGRGIDESVNYGGNLEVVPPHSANGKDYPFGRIYIGGGNSTVLGAPLNRHMNREELALLNAQQVQGPVIEISSEWLAVGHVDEFSQAIPDRSGSGRGWKMAWASPALGRRALRDLQARGLGSTVVFRGRQSQTTVDRILRDTALMRFNDAVQARLDSNKQRLMSTCGLTAADFVELPTLFEDIGFDGEDMGVALNPGVANCITVNDTLYVPDPEGPRDGTLDVWQEQVLAATRPLGLRVVFVDVFESYHEMLGESHCGSNVRYRPYDTPWWTR